MEEILGYFGGNTSRGRRNYRKFVEEGLEGEIESPLQKGRGHGIVGDEDFVEGVRDRFLKRVRESREVPGLKGIIRQIAPAKILGVVSQRDGGQWGRAAEEGGKRNRAWAFDGDAVSIWGIESAGDW